MLPVCINLSGRLAVIVGGGKYALRKARNLMGQGCKVRVISTSLLPDFHELDLELEWVAAKYDASHLGDAFIVWACTDDVDVNAVVLADCDSRRILCTAAHHRENSHFKNPVVWRGSDFSAALWTSSGNPVKAQKIRDLWAHLWQGDDFKAGAYLVGFGPGSTDLMTLKCLKLIRQADLILYDDLIDPEILDLCLARTIYVGKRAGKHSMKQDEINQLLYESCLEYRLVVRLKGGDPFVFGRGGEELDFLQKRGIHVEVVPGITSALAAAATAKVPLTHRGVSRSLTFQTAHHLDDSPPIYPIGGTLVLYMGANKLGLLAQQLITQGWDSKTPVVLVHAVGMPTEEIKFCTISSMLGHSMPSPLCVIVGEIGQFHDK